MGNKPHPLEVFRATPKGFDSATTDPEVRRRVQGKVLTTTKRDESDSERKPRAPRRVEAKRPATTASVLPPRRPAKKGGVGYGAKLLWTALGIVLVVVGYVWVMGPDDEGQVPLKGVAGAESTEANESAEHAPLTPAGDEAAAAGPGSFTIQLSSYKGTAKGLEIAQAAQLALFERGFESAQVIGYQDDGGAFTSYALIVGQASRREALDGLLAAVHGIDDWGSGAKSPFADAHVIAAGN